MFSLAKPDFRQARGGHVPKPENGPVSQFADALCVIYVKYMINNGIKCRRSATKVAQKACLRQSPMTLE